MRRDIAVLKIAAFGATVLAWCASPAPAPAGPWPGWRGPTGQGLSEEADVPVKWSTTENVRWKVKLPAPGNSTPAVWGDRVFITQASDMTLWPPKRLYQAGGGPAVAERRSVMCFARADGELLWQRDVIYKQEELTHGDNPFCSASPVTDGQRVVATHGSAGMVCYDFDGNELWKCDLGKMEQIWGNATSPVLYGDLCIQWVGPGSRQVLLAVDKTTGKTAWEHEEPGGQSGTDGKFLGTWATPIVARAGEQDQLIFPVPGTIKGFDPKTGKELWSAAGIGNLVYNSPLYADGVAVFGATAVKVDGTGDITQNRLWSQPGPAFIGSGVIAGGYLYAQWDGGDGRCYEMKTGQERWEDQVPDRPQRVGRDAWGSMVHVATPAGARLYVTDRSGTTLVYAAGPKYELLAANRLGEHTDASIAVSDGDVFIRTHHHLWCIGATPRAADPP